MSSDPRIILGGRRFDASRLRALRWLPLLILVPAVLLGSYFTVPAESKGVVLRFGAFSSIADPGLHFKVPFVDQVIDVPVERRLKLEFGGAPSDGATNRFQISGSRERPLEASMVTGDLNAAVVEWVVQYHISDPREYLFEVRDPELTLRDLSEAAMREIVGDRTIDEVITVGRQEIESTVRDRLRELSAQYRLGFAIEEVQLKNVNPPDAVRASFNEVNQAEQDRENMINVANGEYNKVVPKARGEAEQKISEAEGYKLKRVNEALGDVAAFDAVLAEYLKAPEATRTRIYLETMAEVLPQMAGTWIVDSQVTQLVPMLQGGIAPEVK
ncbi:MAG: FtsH protease activity modulator HflK [Planctomycetes bacterium]|nr:FtsH protease activity modulator HflK [Planctomycetota bacterium]